MPRCAVVVEPRGRSAVVHLPTAAADRRGSPPGEARPRQQPHALPRAQRLVPLLRAGVAHDGGQVARLPDRSHRQHRRWQAQLVPRQHAAAPLAKRTRAGREPGAHARARRRLPRLAPPVAAERRRPRRRLGSGACVQVDFPALGAPFLARGFPLRLQRAAAALRVRADARRDRRVARAVARPLLLRRRALRRRHRVGALPRALPCLHDGLEPRDASRWPRLAEWYAAMEARVPAYACRVQGDAASWRKVLTVAGYGNAGAPPRLLRDEAAACRRSAAADADGTWAAYAAGRPHVAASPCEEAAARLVRSRRLLAADAARRIERTAESAADEALRGVAAALLALHSGDGMPALSPTEAALAKYLAERMCVPRDMGAPAAQALRSLSSA